jgi:hypothetical protein
MKHGSKPSITTGAMRFFTNLLLIFSCMLIVFQGCEKGVDRSRSQADQLSSRRKPPPPPVYFYFSNCSNPAITGNFVAGSATTATITLTYINSPGGNYPAFSSNTVNGVKLTAPAGTLASGTGNVVFTASGIPANAGNMIIPVSIGGSIACNLSLTVLNAPPSGNAGDPGTTPGSIGDVTFTYRGQQVIYTTVRAADGKIWLRQNIGSPQVAVNRNDAASFGHYFQWGRWDDGHQLINSPSITGNSSLQNPSHIPSGNPAFIKGTTSATAWWGTGGNSSNTWSGTTASTTNGKDPCSAIGAGWHMPSGSEWTNVLNAEFISDAASAFDSRLKLTESGYRSSDNGSMVPNFVGGYYWTSDAGNGNTAKNLFFDDAYNAFVGPMTRGYGVPCRCVKN